MDQCRHVMVEQVYSFRPAVQVSDQIDKRSAENTKQGDFHFSWSKRPLRKPSLVELTSRAVHILRQFSFRNVRIHLRRLETPNVTKQLINEHTEPHLLFNCLKSTEFGACYIQQFSKTGFLFDSLLHCVERYSKEPISGSQTVTEQHPYQ